jgi:hypothetical protein
VEDVRQRRKLAKSGPGGSRGVLASLVVAALGVFAPAAHASAVDVDEVRAVLDPEPWVAVADREHVKFGADAWQGPEDLSFRYRIRVRDGSLWLWVDVTDDRPGVSSRMPLVLDHVEL